jgi:hypothetical protein
MSNPPFLKLLIVMVSLFFPNYSPFGRYGWFDFEVDG